MYWNMVILFKLWSNYGYWSLEKALDISTFNFLIIANKNKASKDIYNVSFHQLREKNTKLENCWFWGTSETWKNQQFSWKNWQRIDS
jgi:hypothetical protein